MKKWLLPIALLTLGSSQLAYVVSMMSNLALPSWRADAPISVELWKGFAPGHPSLTPECDPERSIRGALDAWAGSSSLVLELAAGSPISEAIMDSHNLITIADTPSNRSFLGGSLAMTKYWVNGTTIVEADTVVNPDYQWSTQDTAAGWSLERVAMHEFGHSLGLAHSIDRSDAMHFRGGSFVHNFDRLAWDDIAAVNINYPLPGLDLITGTVRGSVTMRGRPAFGAFVVAVDSHGLVAASGLSLPDGSYRIDRLPPGAYTLYVEPLDGPMTPAQLYMGLSSESMDTGFRPQFYRDSMEPLVEVTAGGSVAANFAVAPARSTLDPTWTRIDNDPSQSGGFTGLTTVAQEGTRQHVAVAGTGVASLSDQAGVFFLGSHLSTGTVSRSHRNSSGIDFKWFPVDVGEDAPEGPYSIFVRSPTEVGVMTGALQVGPLLRFTNRFAQFVHLPGQVVSRVLLVNTSPVGDSVGRLHSLEKTGTKRPLEMSGDPEVHPDADFRIPPGGTLLASTQGATQFLGSLRADTSESTFGLVLIDAPGGTASFVASKPLNYFVAPVEVAREGAGGNTGLALVNFDKRPAQVVIQIQDSDGNRRSSSIIELAGEGQIAQYVTELAPGLAADFSGTVAVTANRLIGATVIQTSEEQAFTTFPVIQNRVARRSTFAQFANGEEIRSELLLVNPSPEQTAQDVQVFVRAGGAEVELDGRPLLGGRRSVDIPPLGLVRLRTTGATAWAGHVEVVSAAPVGGVALFHSPIWGTAGVGESVPMKRMALPILRRLSDGVDTGVALVNAEERPVTLQVTARDQAGKIAATTRFALAPSEQIARFTDDLPFDLGLSSEFVGSLWIESDGGVAATVMYLSKTSLTTLPAFELDDR